MRKLRLAIIVVLVLAVAGTGYYFTRGPGSFECLLLWKGICTVKMPDGATCYINRSVEAMSCVAGGG